MKNQMQAQIDDLLAQLKKEREDNAGNSKEMKARMQAEIDELKRQLQERTG